MITFQHILCYHLCYHFRMLSFMLSFDVIIFHGQQMLSFMLSLLDTRKNDNTKMITFVDCIIIFPIIHWVVVIWCYHFFTVRKCYHFCVIIFPCTCWVLSFMLSSDVILFCYHFPPFFFFLKTWHTRSYPMRRNVAVVSTRGSV